MFLGQVWNQFVAIVEVKCRVFCEVVEGLPAGLEGDTAAGAVGVGLTCLGRACEALGRRSPVMQKLSFFCLQRLAAVWDVVSDLIVAQALWEDGATEAFAACAVFLLLPSLLLTLGMRRPIAERVRQEGCGDPVSAIVIIVLQVAFITFFDFYLLFRAPWKVTESARTCSCYSIGRV